MVIFIGEAPSRPSPPEDALAGRCGERLARLLGITREEFLREYRRVNLVPEWPGKGREVPEAVVRQAGIQTWNGTAPGDRLVLCGRRVAHSFGWRNVYLNFPVEIEGRHVLLIAHPSGRCRLWNDAAFTRRTAAVLKQFVGEER